MFITYLKKQWFLMLYKFYLGMSILLMKLQLDSLLVNGESYWYLYKCGNRFMDVTERTYDRYARVRDDYYYQSEMAV